MNYIWSYRKSRYTSDGTLSGYFATQITKEHPLVWLAKYRDDWDYALLWFKKIDGDDFAAIAMLDDGESLIDDLNAR